MNIFLSYSTKDYQYKDEIKITLSKLEQEGKIRLWVDEKNLRAGDEFDSVIKEEIKRADIFLLLLSRNFWASEYIQKKELSLILEKYKNSKAAILPVVLKSEDDINLHSEVNRFNALPRDKESKALKPIDKFEIVDDAYNMILKEIIRHLPKNREVFVGSNFNYYKFFVGCSSNKQENVEETLNQLSIPNENIEIFYDNSSDNFYLERMRNAIKSCEYIILFLDNEFIDTAIFKNYMLPLIHLKYFSGKCGLSIITETNLYNNDIINLFNKQPIKTAKELKREIKSFSLLNNSIKVDFIKIFSIYKILQKYKKDKKQQIKFSNATIELYEDNLLVEKWLMIEPEVRTVEEYALIYKENFNIKDSSYKFGIFWQDGLDESAFKLKSFFESVEILYKIDNIDRVKELFFKQYQGYNAISKFMQTITNSSMSGIEMLDFNKNSNKNGSIFLFLRFGIESFKESELIGKTYELIEQKFNIPIFSNSGKLHKLESFIKTFNRALDILKSNKNIDFRDVVDSIEILKTNLKIIEDLSFIENNQKLIDKPIVTSSKINIKQLFIEPTATFNYKNSTKKEKIKNLIDWFDRELEYKDFLILLGNFGHGKTTLFKYLVANLSKEYKKDRPIPVFLTLREHFKNQSSLQEAVTNAIMPNSRMSNEFRNSHNWIIFCDGFDELNIFHQDNLEWVTLVFSSLLKASQEKNIKIVISSRPILFMDKKIYNQTLGNFEIIDLDDFSINQIDLWLKKWSQVNKPITLQMLKDRGILNIAKIPIILFLIAMMFHDELISKEKKFSKSEIYRLFFDWTIKSSKFLQDEANFIKHNIPKDYRKIIQEIAWQIFIHPDSKSGLLHYKILLKELQRKFKVFNFNWDERIFVIHAFKESKKEHIEFLHQSLREYLVAEKIFEVFYKIIDEPEYQIDIAYNEILLNRPVTGAKVEFFIDMTKSLSKDEKNRLKIRAKNIAHWATILYMIAQKDSSIFKGYEIYRRYSKSITKEHFFSENQVVIANLALLGIFFEINLYDVVEEDFNLELISQIQNFFKSDTQLEVFENLLAKYLFDNLKFSHTQFNGFDFNKFVFKDVYFKNLEFNSCEFKENDFRDITFENVSFNSCNFYKLEWSNFKHIGVCEYKNCNFFKYNYQNKVAKERVVYIECIFKNSDLYYENFEGAVFNNCIFIDTKFSTNNKFDEDSMEIEFINCVLKNGDKTEVLNGKNLDIFVETM